MIRFLGLIAVALTPLAAYSHVHYCDHIHEPNGKVTWRCDDVKRKTLGSDFISRDSNVVDVKDEQIAATNPRGFLRALRVTALVSNRGFPTVTASVSKIGADTALAKLKVFVGTGTVREPAEFIVPIEQQLQEVELDPGSAKIVIE